MKKKIKLSDCDKVCVVSLRDANIGDDVFSAYRLSIKTVSGLIEVLLENHIDFTVQYFNVSEPSLDSLVSDHSCFVYGLIFSKEGFISN
ncbi:MAG: hypothetical protein IJX97_00520 [Clostridia bacterium]|nr:hypothetical protein [Clostridia bacterium]